MSPAADPKNDGFTPDQAEGIVRRWTSKVFRRIADVSNKPTFITVIKNLIGCAHVKTVRALNLHIQIAVLWTALYDPDVVRTYKQHIHPVEFPRFVDALQGILRRRCKSLDLERKRDPNKPPRIYKKRPPKPKDPNAPPRPYRPRYRHPILDDIRQWLGDVPYFLNKVAPELLENYVHSPEFPIQSLVPINRLNYLSLPKIGDVLIEIPPQEQLFLDLCEDPKHPIFDELTFREILTSDDTFTPEPAPPPQTPEISIPDTANTPLYMTATPEEDAELLKKLEEALAQAERELRDLPPPRMKQDGVHPKPPTDKPIFAWPFREYYERNKSLFELPNINSLDDRVIHFYRKWKQKQHILNDIPEGMTFTRYLALQMMRGFENPRNRRNL